MFRPHPSRLIAVALLAATIGCDDPTAPRRTLPTQASLATNVAEAASADASPAQLIALVQDALDRLAPALARVDRDKVVPQLNALAGTLSARNAVAARQQLAATERVLDAMPPVASPDPDVESLRLQLEAIRSALTD